MTPVQNSLLVIAGAFILAIGCQTTPKSDETEDEKPAIGMTAVPSNQSSVSGATVAIWRLGSVDYDMLALPLVSPDGRFLAVESGVAPTWPMVLADPNADPSSATRMKIWTLDPINRTMAQHLTLDQPLLLGRGSNNDGFLVESIQPNGSRWIGLVDWNSGKISWLVRNEHINTQAAFGPNGQLAYARRLKGAQHFELVIRTGASQWVQSQPSADLLMPFWSGYRDGLFFIKLRSGLLDLVYVEASSAAAARQSKRVLPLAKNATARTAYQMLIGQPADMVMAADNREQLLFFHPSRYRMAMWAPFAGPEFSPMMLAPNSIGAVRGPTPDTLIVATKTQLLRESIKDSNAEASLISGLQIPRATSSKTAPYLLLSPNERLISISAFRELTED
ncbi:MAG: hypothetical protein P8J86_12345 [Phycisphaerales bacterium]|nr:hypothetical protein [Phycisphaerales bacterium]